MSELSFEVRFLSLSLSRQGPITVSVQEVRLHSETRQDVTEVATLEVALSSKFHMSQHRFVNLVNF